MAEKRRPGTRVIMRRGMSRRDFLKMGGVGLAGVAMLGTTACGGGGGGGQGGDGPVEFTFSFGPDNSNTLQEVVSRFNEQFDGQYTANYREMAADTGQYFDQLRTEFQAGGGDIDLIGGDVIWPAQFAANGWILDLSDRFAEDERQNFLDGPIEACTFEGGIYGVPWFTDAGMMYYRQDWLDNAGMEPPTTWDELKEMALQISQDENAESGFVFQGAEYEGGVVDGLEYIWTHGGSVLAEGSADEVVIDSPESVSGLQTWRSMIEDGVSPQAVTNYQETESHTAFLNGRAVFLRNWPYVYALAEDPEQSRINQDQIGIAALPVASGNETASGLGGWNFYINAASDEAVQEAAYEFAMFASSAEQQKFRALEGSFLPTRNELYDDQEILDAVPVIALGRDALENSRPRPVSPYYSDMSLRMAEQFNAALRGATPPQDAVSTLQNELSDIVQAG